MSLVEEFKKSIKSPDTEEKLDLVFYRPAGFAIAKTAQVLRMTPTQLTLIGMIMGVYGGILFYQRDNTLALIWASILFVWAGVFDSSDGQLARMTKQSSKIGLVLDGICDNVVFGAAYLASSAALIPEYGYWIFLIAVIAGVGHSFQSAVLDFYHREYLYFGYGKVDGDYWNPSVAEAKAEIEKAGQTLEGRMAKLRLNWIRQQQTLSSRSDSERQQMRAIVNGSDKALRDRFCEAYRKHNLKMLSLWRINGTNFHTICIIFFTFMRRFDLYLILVDIVVLNILMIFIRKIQRRQDEKLFKEFGIRP